MLLAGFIRTILYAATGGLFGLGLGFGWWSILTAIVGWLLLTFMEEYTLELIGLAMAAAFYAVLVGIGLCTASLAWTILGAIVVGLTFVLVWTDTLDDKPRKAHAQPSYR